MKLHLPTSFRAALLCALCGAAAYADGDTPESNRKIDIALITGIPSKLPSNSSNYVTPEGVDADGNLSLSGNDKMGAFNKDENGNCTELITGFGTYTVRGSLSGTSVTSSNPVTKNVKVDGTLSIAGNAQVVLGGQYKYDYYYYVGTSTLNAEYTGIIADKIFVNCTETTGFKNLSTWNVNVNTLEVQDGTVDIHNCGGYATSGNSFFVVNAPEDSKQVRIKESLIVHDGNVTIGHGGSQATSTSFNHVSVAFGDLICEGAQYDSSGQLKNLDNATVKSSSITLSNGRLDIAGKSASVGGMDITQNGGYMNISGTSHHELSDYGDFIVNQGSDDDDNPETKPEMTIGKIIAYNKYYKNIKDKIYELGREDELEKRDLMPSVTVNQEGDGVITMKGVDFTAEIGASTEMSSINQSGSGTINLNGNYVGANFSISQTGVGGDINLTGTMTTGANAITGKHLELTTASDLNISGTLNLGAGASINIAVADVLEGDAAAALVVQDGGELSLTGSASITISDVAESVVLESIDLSQDGVSTFTIDLMSGIDSDLLGWFTLTESEFSFELEPVSTYATDSIGSITTVTLITQGLQMGADGSTLQAVVQATVTTTTAAIPEPTTATLSLLALAGLAARRRRR